MKTLKTFTATHLNKHAQEVFAAAKDDGHVLIEHSNYFGGVFTIVWNPYISMDDIKTAAEMMDSMSIDPTNRIIDKVDGRYYTEDK